MPFKTNLPDAPMPALPGFSALGFEGSQSEAFLQAQTMNDVAALATGRWQWNGWLNPKGRVIALFALARVADDRFLAILPDFPAAELLPLLQRFVFRAKVKLQVRDDLVFAAEFDAESLPAGASDHLGGAFEEGFFLDCSGDGGARRLWLLPSTTAVTVSPDADARWRQQDIVHGLPRLPASQNESWTPHMLSLERLNAFSLKKGCYPGQEIVARTHYLGQSKRSLYCLQADGLIAGASVTDPDGQAIGVVLADATRQRMALAVCSRPEPKSPHWLVAGQPVACLSLLAGLARPAVTGITMAGSQTVETRA